MLLLQTISRIFSMIASNESYAASLLSSAAAEGYESCSMSFNGRFLANSAIELAIILVNSIEFGPSFSVTARLANEMNLCTL